MQFLNCHLQSLRLMSRKRTFSRICATRFCANLLKPTERQHGFLPAYYQPSASKNIVLEIFRKAPDLKNSLGKTFVVVAFDPAIYAKTVEIMWHHHYTKNKIFRLRIC